MLKWCSTFPSLYKMALRSLVEWKHFDIKHLEDLPGFMKEDLLRAALDRGKCKENISYFLHPYIKQLNINECEITCKELEDISQCHQIRALEMNARNYHRSSHPSCALEKLFSQLKFLIKLYIQRNDGITDRVAAVLAQNCLHLQELDLSGSINLTDDGVKSLSTLSQLRSFNLSDTPIGDPALKALGSGCCSQTLTELKLNNCVNITDEGINLLIQGCKNLLILVFCGCPKVSVDCQLALESILNKGKRSSLVTWTIYF